MVVTIIAIAVSLFVLETTGISALSANMIVPNLRTVPSVPDPSDLDSLRTDDAEPETKSHLNSFASTGTAEALPFPPRRQLVGVKDSEELRAALARLAEFDEEAERTAWELRLESPLIELSSPLTIPSNRDVRIVSASSFSSSPSSTKKKSTASSGLSDVGLVGAALVARENTGLFRVGDGASLELANVELHGGTAQDGGAISNLGGHVYLSGCSLSNHTAWGRGGAIFSRGGSLLLENTTLENCRADMAGGAVFIAGVEEEEEEGGGDLQPLTASSVAASIVALLGDWMQGQPSSAQVASADALSRRRRLLSRTSVSFSRVSFHDNTAPSGSDFMLEELGDTFPSLVSSSPTVPLSSSPHSSSSLSSWLWPLLFKATSSPKQKSVKVASEQGEGKGGEKRGGSSSEQMEALVAIVVWSMSFLWIAATAMVVASAVGALIFAAAAALLKTAKSSTSTKRSSSSSSSGGLLGGPLSPLPPKKHQQHRRSVVARAVRWLLLFGSRGSSTEDDDELGESPTNASATSFSTCTTIGRGQDSWNNHALPPPPPPPPSLTLAKRWEQFRTLLQQEKRALERTPKTTPPLRRLAAEVDGVDPEAPPTPTIVIEKSRAREVLSPAGNRADDDDEEEEEVEENDDDVESVGLLRASEKKKNKEVTTTPPRDCQDSDHDLDDDDNEAGCSEGSRCGGGGRSRTLLPELVVPLSALEIEALQAKGAHSTVYRAAVAPLAGEGGGRFGTRVLSDATKRRTVALKRIQLPPLKQQHSRHDDNDSEELVAGWRREASIMASLPRHHALVRLLGVVCDDTPVVVASSSSSSSSSSQVEMQQGLGGGGRASEPFGVGLLLEFMPLGSLRDALTAGLLLPWTLAAPTAASTGGGGGGGGGAGVEALAGMMTRGVSNAPTQVLMHRSDSTTNILPAPLPRHPDPVIALSAAGHQIALDVASAVAHLHLHGVAHRDLKSSNVLLDERGRAKVADFGDATTTACEGRRCRDSYPRHPFTHQQQGLVEARADFLPPRPLPQPAAASPPCFGGYVVGGSGGLDGEEVDGSSSGGSGHMRGTLLYASPELLKGEAHNGRSADVWALGMVLVEVATGQTLLQLWQHEQRVRRAQREQSRRSSRHPPPSSSSSPFLRPAFSAPSKVPCIVLPSTASGAPPHPTAAAVPNTLGGRSLPPVPDLLQACGWRPDVRKRSAGGASLPVPRDSPQRFGPREEEAAAAGGLVRSSVLESCWAAAPRDRPSAAAILQHLEDHSLRPSPSSDTDQACLVGLSSPTPVACQQDQDQEEGGEVAAKAGVDALLLLPDPSPNGDLQNGANNDDLHRQTSPQLVTVQHDDLHRGPAPSPTNLSRENDRSFSASACAGGSPSSSPLSKPPIPQGTATTGFSPPPEAAAVVTLQPRPGSIGSASPLTLFHGSGSGGGGCGGGGGAIQDVREERDRDCDDPPYADTAVLLPHTSSSSSPSGGRRMASSSLVGPRERPAVGNPEPVSSFGGERTGANGHSRTVAESEDAEPAVSDRFLEAWGAWL